MKQSDQGGDAEESQETSEPPLVLSRDQLADVQKSATRLIDE
jgi:hypothetical protein